MQWLTGSTLWKVAYYVPTHSSGILQQSKYDFCSMLLLQWSLRKLQLNCQKSESHLLIVQTQYLQHDFNKLSVRRGVFPYCNSHHAHLTRTINWNVLHSLYSLPIFLYLLLHSTFQLDKLQFRCSIASRVSWPPCCSLHFRILKALYTLFVLGPNEYSYVLDIYSVYN